MQQSKESIFKLHIKIKSLLQSKIKHDVFSSTKQILYFIDHEYEICPKSTFYKKLWQVISIKNYIKWKELYVVKVILHNESTCVVNIHKILVIDCQSWNFLT